MAIGFLPEVEECCGDFPLEFAIFGVFIYDCLRAGLWIFEYTSAPLCQNYPRIEGFGLYMRIYSGVLMALAILRVVVLFVVLLAFCIECLEASLFTDSYVWTTFTLVLMTVIYFALYQVLVAKAGYKCYSEHIKNVGASIPTPEGIDKEEIETHVKSHAWVAPVCLFFSLLEAALLIYFAIVVNSFQKNVVDTGQGKSAD